MVKITNPKVDGADLVYTYKIIDGKMPAAGGATTLFIDWIGVGGGVGPGSTASASAAAVWVSVSPVRGVAPGETRGGPVNRVGVC